MRQPKQPFFALEFVDGFDEEVVCIDHGHMTGRQVMPGSGAVVQQRGGVVVSADEAGFDAFEDPQRALDVRFAFPLGEDAAQGLRFEREKTFSSNLKTN